MDLGISSFPEGIVGSGTSLSDLGWDILYTAAALPQNSTPAWTSNVIGSPTAEISPAGILHLVNTALGAEVNYDITDSNLDNAVGSTLQIRTQVIDAASQFTFDLVLTDGTRAWEVSILNDRVRLLDDQISEVDQDYLMDTTDDYHIYHMTMIGTAIKVYADGVLRLQGTSDVSEISKNINIGSLVDGTIASEYNIDYIYYSTGGAFIP